MTTRPRAKENGHRQHTHCLMTEAKKKKSRDQTNDLTTGNRSRLSYESNELQPLINTVDDSKQQSIWA